jgi:hypothetical protein
MKEWMMRKKKAAAKSAKQTKAKTRKPTATVAPDVVPTLVITVNADCSLANNQGLDPPHVSKSQGGGFPHQIKFQVVVHAWVCLPKGVFTVDPPVPLEIEAGEEAGPFIVKHSTNSDAISYSHSCGEPCGEKLGNGDVIIINA